MNFLYCKGILTFFSIRLHPFRTYLRYRLTLYWWSVYKKPCSLDDYDSHIIIYYSCQDFQFYIIHIILQLYFYSYRTPSYPYIKLIYVIVSVVNFSPVYCLRIISRLISFYTFIIRWLLLSLLFRCLRNITWFLTLSLHLGTLTIILILFISNKGLSPPSRLINLKQYL